MPTPMVDQDAPRFRHLADPQGPLFQPHAKGNNVEVVGKMPWQDKQVYKLKVTFHDGAEDFVYLDAQSFLPVRKVNTMYVVRRKKSIDLEQTYEDYRAVNGVQWPFTEKANAPEADFSQTITWKTIEVNQPLDDAAFTGPQG